MFQQGVVRYYFTKYYAFLFQTLYVSTGCSSLIRRRIHLYISFRPCMFQQGVVHFRFRSKFRPPSFRPCMFQQGVVPEQDMSELVRNRFQTLYVSTGCSSKTLESCSGHLSFRPCMFQQGVVHMINVVRTALSFRPCMFQQGVVPILLIICITAICFRPCMFQQGVVQYKGSTEDETRCFRPCMFQQGVVPSRKF